MFVMTVKDYLTTFWSKHETALALYDSVYNNLSAGKSKGKMTPSEDTNGKHDFSW